jgi:prophage regulatory protein
MTKTTAPPPHETPYMTMVEAMAETGYSRPSLYRKINDGTFPQPVQLGANKIAFRRADVKRWHDARPSGTLTPVARKHCGDPTNCTST